MRRFREIVMLLPMLLMLGACNSSRGDKADDEVIARVGRASLYRSELVASMPSGATETDSLSYSKAFIEKWIVEELKYEEAENLFSESEEDIDRLVEEYRRSLLVHRLDRHYLEAEPCGEITDEDITKYYNENKSNLLVVQPMVKGEIVAINDGFRNREQLVRWFESSDKERRDDFEESCRKNNLLHIKFEEWAPFADFLSNLPLLRTSRHEGLLGNRGVQRIHYDKTYYYFRITAALKEGDVMPLHLAKENIRQILINRHRTEVIRRQEENIMKSAISSGHARILGEENE